MTPVDPPTPLRNRLTFRLTGGVTAVLLIVGVPFLFAFHDMERRQKFEALSRSATRISQLLVEGLRSSMLAGHPDLINETVRNLSEHPDVERVMLLDHRGMVRVSSDAAFEGRTLDRQQAGSCAVCHSGSSAAAPQSRTIDTEENGRRVFRAMSVIPNQPACHRCHDPAVKTNGILLVDLAVGEEDRRSFANVGGTLALGSVMAVVTILALVFMLRRTVHAPLDAVIGACRRIVGGDLAARVAMTHKGEFGLLASQVNRMTDHLARSISTMESQRRELQEILEAVDDEIVVLDREQRVVVANRSFREGSGQDDEDLAGRYCREAAGSRFPCLADLPDGCPALKVFETGELQKGIMSRVHADGSEQVIEIHASPLRGQDGEVALAVEVRRDISDRRRMQASLAQSERLASLGLLASGLSHEINNPLGAIATSVDGLRRRLAADPGFLNGSSEELDHALLRIADQVRRSRAITDRLLKVARPPGRARILVDVNGVVEDTLGVLSHQIARSGITSRLELAQGLPPLRDDGSIAQVVMNLTMNALQAMEGDGGEMRIETTALDEGIQIAVHDTGRGIPPEYLRRIYEPFFTTKPPGKGTGLGLFITHAIVTDLGGTIEARSRPGAGTSFIVRLPQRRRATP